MARPLTFVLILARLLPLAISFLPAIQKTHKDQIIYALRSDGIHTKYINTTVAATPYQIDEYGRPTDDPSHRNLLASPWTGMNLQTPHSGRKFQPTHPYKSKHSRIRSLFNKLSRNNRRFTEGWYYRLTLPTYNESFVFIFSIEDAGRYVHSNHLTNMRTDVDVRAQKSKLSRLRKLLCRGKTKSPLTLACMQLLGPQDTYLCQSDVDDTKFWGWKYAQGLGCTFEWKDPASNDGRIAAMLPEEWREKVQAGFQILPFHFQGRLDGHDGSLGGVKAQQGVAGTAEYDFTIRPVAGWGNYPPLSSIGGLDKYGTAEYGASTNGNTQYSTAGWLANYPVFEPHWQITMSNARASGSLNWNGSTYVFEDAPFYGEQNWGGAFPTKWYWAQCNSFNNHPDLAFTAGGGIRQLPFSFLPGKKTETLGLIGIHHNGTFYEIVPWTGEMDWKVWPWGKWEFRGRCTDTNGMQFEAEVVASTDLPGVLLRAPTKDEGMQYFCRDSGFGHVTLSLWYLEWDEETGDFVRIHGKDPIIDRAQSGPWWDVWTVSSKMSRPLKWMVRLPYIIRNSLK
ncbi:hypothetical protein ACHAXN_010830 [Cyclotella atomus]